MTLEIAFLNVEFNVIRIASNWIFMLGLAYYLLTNLQWYSYKISRVLFKHHKWRWHIFYFIVPITLMLLLGDYFYFYLYLVYLPFLIYWAKNLDKPLVFTNRVERFLFVYIAFILFGEVLYYRSDSEGVHNYLYLPSIILAVIISNLMESILLNRYAKVAKEKIESLQDLTIIAVTGSFGKTSLKNFLAQILSDKFQVYATPRSVNTFIGVVNDINNNLPTFCDIYIVEAGARGEGDILEITNLVSPHYGIIGKIGSAHIEYFKDVYTIQKTKYELAQSSRLKTLYTHSDNEIPEGVQATFFPEEVRNIHATLDGTLFELKINGQFYPFKTSILGAFNAHNISAAITLAYKLGISIERIQKEVEKLMPVPHRLNKLEVNQKILIDDSFNGNIEGMLEAIRLTSLYCNGRRIIVTPGLVESCEEDNVRLAEAIDSVFQIVIITGELNSEILTKHITKAQKILLKEKRAMESILKASTHAGDIILFANDAPSYI
ncbi:UDP-MurNac-pentapeptide presynthetase MurF [Helicobacter monodelphidis]|uniref:Mur ligase family protein n=1 Tax=Helicobacter sp. 15-1451 TaxID=2004995 RepID=UPI000DCBB8CD|nr:UDP-N-acetylmuramoyl-tripeptide--D-alanyl-D-alanine ligase [Helicobacter sp. 15-1451]RAX57675.1 UDP-MurNac-pentapeptide presynthetase MurF [Helicobacter sp. 15-1451]